MIRENYLITVSKYLCIIQNKFLIYDQLLNTKDFTMVDYKVGNGNFYTFSRITSAITKMIIRTASVELLPGR